VLKEIKMRTKNFDTFLHECRQLTNLNNFGSRFPGKWDHFITNNRLLYPLYVDFEKLYDKNNELLGYRHKTTKHFIKKTALYGERYKKAAEKLISIIKELKMEVK